jgi:hypothetical protein
VIVFDQVDEVCVDRGLALNWGARLFVVLGSHSKLVLHSDMHHQETLLLKFKPFTCNSKARREK